MLTSGVLFVRRPLLNAGTGYLHILPIIGFQTVAVLYYIFKEPLFWLTALLFFGLGVRLTPAGGSDSGRTIGSIPEDRIFSCRV